jgi:hypothetical protein
MPASTGPGGERTDTFVAGSPGPASVTYTLTNGSASVTLTFNLTVVAAT